MSLEKKPMAGPFWLFVEAGSKGGIRAGYRGRMQAPIRTLATAKAGAGSEKIDGRSGSVNSLGGLDVDL
jgi:hypothetical protein